ncbi:MAG: endolytic transglycosylase MltG [Actinomycetota bacterium]
MKNAPDDARTRHTRRRPEALAVGMESHVVSYEQRELVGSDPHSLLFGPDDHHGEPAGEPPSGRRSDNRGHHRHQRRRRRSRRLLLLTLTVLALIIVAASGWFVVRPIVLNHLAPKDWAGSGTGDVLVKVNPGDGADAIAQALLKAGVVRTSAAFRAAASANSDSRSIQPGVYRVHKQMAAAQALALMLDPSSRVAIKVSVPEGSSEKKIIVMLATALGVPSAQVQQAADDVGNLGLPAGYQQGTNPPSSAEGFFYPDTYSLDPGTTPTDALQQMIVEFTSKDRELKFAAGAMADGMTPYQALIIASMIEREAKFADDRAKVARVVLNRIAARMPLGIDATSLYGEELAGRDPKQVDYDVPAPYNTRLSPGLPPTPIGNPGEAALTAAVNPAAGNWLYYVNGDAAGHLYFTADPKAFTAAVERCQANKWGCT